VSTRFVNREGSSDETIAKKHRALAGFFRYAVTRRRLKTSPMPSFVRRRGGPSFTPYIYSEAELKRILAAVPAAASTRSGIDADTLRTFVLLLYGAGLRRGEARRLKVEDVDLPRSLLHIKGTKFFKSVRILGKGSKERRCPLWATTIEELRRLAGQRPNDAPMFLNRRGEPVTRYGIHTMVERYVARLRATAPQLRGKRISPHVIRHSTATHLLQAGVDINTIRAWLGHVSLDTTNIYAETDLATKKRALATLDRGRTRKASGGWSRKPNVMEFLRSL
jgi:integrase